jgi:hypothetical protein
MILLVQHRVSQFDSWKPVFEGEGSIIRIRHGATRHWLYRSLDDPNDVVVSIDFPTEERARSFVADPSLKEEMGRAGVQGQPAITFCEEVEGVSY